jgi:hypothetical protein
MLLSSSLLLVSLPLPLLLVPLSLLLSGRKAFVAG